MMIRNLLKILALVTIGFYPGVSASAVQVNYVQHNAENQFVQGEPNQVVISSEGEISLAYQWTTLYSGNKDLWSVNDLASDGQGNLYVATSGKGGIYRIAPGQPAELMYGPAEGEQVHVFSLGLDAEGKLLAGTGGKAGQLLRIDSNKNVEVVFAEEEIKYVWSIVVGPDGRIFLGTGPTGKVIVLDQAGGKEVLYQAKEKNILVLALHEGILYAGGDENGLVYRIEPASKKVTIAYDTQHGEISGLVFDEQSNLFISTADAGAARPGMQLILSNGEKGKTEAAVDKKDGKPEGGTTSVTPAGGAAAVEGVKNETNAAGGQPVPVEPKKQEAAAGAAPAAGEPAPGQPAQGGEGAAPAPKPAPVRPAATANDVYRMSREGYVVNLFSRPIILFDMGYEAANRQLILGTGNDGQLLRLDVEAKEAAVLYKAKPAPQISAVLVRERAVYMGTSNPASVIRMDKAFAVQGEYISPAIDAEQVSRWGKMQMDAAIPEGASLQVSTRTGNTANPDKGGWQEWTEPAAVGEDMDVQSAPGRFFQYRLLFASSTGQATPVVREVKLANMVPNLPPLVQTVEVVRDTPKEPTALLPRTFTVKWQAGDSNKDKLLFNLYLRPVGNSRWVRLEKDLDKPQYTWNSLTAADGRYEIKVEASDRADNSPGDQLIGSRISETVVVDNTAPEVSDLSCHVSGKMVKILGTISDEFSVLTKVEYSVDSATEWKKVLPEDGIFDSRLEMLRFELEIAQPGEHLVTLRLEEASGNVLYRNLSVVIPE